MGPLKLPKMSKAEIKQVINDQILCRIAFRGTDVPHIAPFQYVSIEDNLYFHFTNYGKKIGLLEEGKPVCVEIEKYNADLSEYSFIVMIGRLKVVADYVERDTAIEKMVNIAKKRSLSTNFLFAHGLPTEAGWDSLSSDKSLIIVKLDNVTEVIGLKSP